MTLERDIITRLESSSDENLLLMLAKSDDFLPEAIECAKRLLALRGKNAQLEQQEAHRKLEGERVRRMEEMITGGGSATRDSLTSYVQHMIPSERISHVGVCFWNVIDDEPTSGFRPVDLIAGITLGGLAGAVASKAVRTQILPNRPKYYAKMGIVAVGDRLVYRVEFGNVGLQGTDRSSLALPHDAVAAIPYIDRPPRISPIEPADASSRNDILRVDSIGQGGAAPLSEMQIASGGLLDSMPTAENLADAIKAILKFPAPDDIIARLLAPADSVSLEHRESVDRALADEHYSLAFFRKLSSQDRARQHALYIAAYELPKGSRDRLLRHLQTQSSPRGEANKRMPTLVYIRICLGAGIAFLVWALLFISVEGWRTDYWAWGIALLVLLGPPVWMITKIRREIVWYKRECDEHSPALSR